jgi:2-C-methyl-D-erythritol 4-phosphate cytidylyltransferase
LFSGAAFSSILVPMNATALIVAAGSGERYGGDIPKQFQKIAGKPLLSWTISRFEEAEAISSIVIVCGEDFLLHVNNAVVNPYSFGKVTQIVPGGETRCASVRKGLDALPRTTRLVAIHDGVRPLVRPSDINRVVAGAAENRAAILGQKATDTVKRVESGLVLATMERERMYLAETPQAFQFDLICEAHARATEKQLAATDDSALVEMMGFKVVLVESSAPNPKLTGAADFDFIEMMLMRENHE